MGSSSDEELALIALLLDEETEVKKKEKRKGKKRIWVHPILKKRKFDGEHWTLFEKLLKYDDKFLLF